VKTTYLKNPRRKAGVDRHTSIEHVPETLLEHWCSPIELRSGEVLPPPPPESKREAEAFLAWLRAAVEACGVDPEPYLKELEGELRRREGKSASSPELALPVWRSLLEGRRRDGKPLEEYYEAVRWPLFDALAEKGLLRKLG